MDDHGSAAVRGRLDIESPSIRIAGQIDGEDSTKTDTRDVIRGVGAVVNDTIVNEKADNITDARIERIFHRDGKTRSAR